MPLAFPTLLVDETLGPEDAECAVIPSIGKALRQTMASAVRSVRACTPEMRRERKRLAGRLWINMRARSEHPSGSGLAVELTVWTSHRSSWW